MSLHDYVWYCDNCHASLDEQSGFDSDTDHGFTWVCTECGQTNYINGHNILGFGYTGSLINRILFDRSKKKKDEE